MKDSKCVILVLTAVTLASCKATDKASKNASSSASNKPLESPTLITPNSNPYASLNESINLHGTCTDGNTVYLGGDDDQSVPCMDSEFSFELSKSENGNYTFLIYQSNQSAKRLSETITFQWNRGDSNLPDPSPSPNPSPTSTPDAPTITSPTSRPFYSSLTLTLTGTCTPAHTVKVSGDLSQSTSCSTSGNYSFVISPMTEGVYNLTVSQVNDARITSIDNPTIQWILDMAAPSTNITSAPPSRNLLRPVAFSFDCTEPSAFQCKLDNDPWIDCESPYVLSDVDNGAHQFTVAATDSAGNTDPTPPLYTWTQENYQTIALFHLETSAYTSDSSLYSGSYNNQLTNHYSESDNGQFNKGAKLESSKSAFLEALDHAALELLDEKMTAESWIEFKSLPAKNKNYVIVSKMGVSGQYGWEFGLTKTGSKYYLYFLGSLDGTSAPTVVKSSSLPSGLTDSDPHHYAVTWDAGAVQFFFDGIKKGGGTIGSGSVLLFDSTAPLRIGSTESGNYLDGTLDELRLSKSVRWSSDFTPPSSPYTAD